MPNPPTHPTTILALLLIASSPTSAQSFQFPDEYQNSVSESARSSSQLQSSCVTLERCGSLMRMWESRYIMMNTLEALGALERAQCGFLGSSDTPLFRCPEEPLDGIRRMVISTGGVSSMSTPACAGTVKLFADDDPEPDVVARESRRKVKVVVDRVVVTGNCCWRLCTSKSFRGRSLTVRPGATHADIGTIKSIKKLDECPATF
eukprot:GFUD01003035.1.p1 GENE.GFUD01003035.1~~GFUD01003035.1.p1  ORF type:complete len:205 (-),score=52.87 GFUD01003035.1:590-1204(-)